MMQMELSLSYSRLVLVGLNLGTERFDEVPLPKNMGKPLTFNLAALNECLCLISGYGTCRNGKNLVLDHIDVWMMRGCGVEQSWVKLFTVEQLEGRQHFSYLRPIAYSVTGREVLLEMDKRKFLWFSLEKKSLKHSKVSGGFDTFDSFVTLGTLVPLYYGGGDEKDGKKGVEEQDDSVIKEMK
ncbi:F-box protein CPR1 [Capsicum annuum]|uniref:F-box protein CPR1 n=1 Tax=Capsicum annuum TaxID=4072 RepID=UPI001FB0FBA2|nr:F-box protein CPR1 [Capsicum annuum]